MTHHPGGKETLLFPSAAFCININHSSGSVKGRDLVVMELFETGSNDASRFHSLLRLLESLTFTVFERLWASASLRVAIEKINVNPGKEANALLRTITKLLFFVGEKGGGGYNFFSGDRRVISKDSRKPKQRTFANGSR